MNKLKINVLVFVILAVQVLSWIPLFATSAADTLPPIAASFTCLSGTYAVSSDGYVGYDFETCGNDVKVLQAALNLVGYKAGYADGHFDDITLEALKAFQLESFGYSDAVAGPKTWRKLADLCNNRILPIFVR